MSDDYPKLLYDRCKDILKMTDEEVAQVIGVSRPTLTTILKNPGTIRINQVRALENHLKWCVAQLQSFEPITQEETQA